MLLKFFSGGKPKNPFLPLWHYKDISHIIPNVDGVMIKAFLIGSLKLLPLRVCPIITFLFGCGCHTHPASIPPIFRKLTFSLLFIQVLKHPSRITYLCDPTIVHCLIHLALFSLTFRAGFHIIVSSLRCIGDSSQVSVSIQKEIGNQVTFNEGKILEEVCVSILRRTYCFWSYLVLDDSCHVEYINNRSSQMYRRCITDECFHML